MTLAPSPLLMRMPRNAPRPTKGPRFIPPPDSIFRCRPLVDPGLLAVIGAPVAVVFLAVLLGLLETAFGVRVGNVLMRMIRILAGSR